MIIEKPGPVTDNILMLGQKESCVYLLKGKEEYALLGGGMVYIVPRVLEQLEAFHIDEEKIRRMVILHSHFDHCGIVPFFKKRWPWVKVSASKRAGELLSNPKVIETITSLNRALIAEVGMQEEIENLGVESYEIEVEEFLKGGDTVPCGDLTLEVIDAPGHSSCSIAVYVPQEKALFASDAAGIPFGDKVFTAANSNFDQYQASLEKMAGYEVDVFAAEHFGVRTGSQARRFLKNSIASAARARKHMEDSYRRTRDAGKSTQEIVDKLMKGVPKGFMSRDVFGLVIGQMMHFIAKKIETSEKSPL